MKTTTYWKAKCRDDADCYSIRARTKREVLAELAEHGCRRGKDGYGEPCFVDGDDGVSPRFDLPEKVQINYTDQMDLIQQLRGEGGCDF